MTEHIKAAVSAAIGRAHVAEIASYNVKEGDQASLWIEVVYRDLAQGPGADLLQQIMDNVGDVTCAADPRAIVSFIDEADMMAFAAE